MTPHLRGLVAATCTPFHADGTLDLSAIPRLVDYLVDRGASGIYIGGSTGEGMSLASQERCDAAGEFVRAARGRIRTIVHVGHNSLAEARRLAAHAREIGADAISATAPSYFKVDTERSLAECMEEVASGAPELPFYYYHIPRLTGVDVDLVAFLELAIGRIENLAGVKYTSSDVGEFHACMELYGDRVDLVWGCDEMLLSALVVGARSGIGSTYNVATPLYAQIIQAFENNDLASARRLQGEAVRLIRVLMRYPFVAAVKHVLGFAGVACGPCRNPLASLTDDQARQLDSDLREAQIFHWVKATPAAATLDSR